MSGPSPSEYRSEQCFKLEMGKHSCGNLGHDAWITIHFAEQCPIYVHAPALNCMSNVRGDFKVGEYQKKDVFSKTNPSFYIMVDAHTGTFKDTYLLMSGLYCRKGNRWLVHSGPFLRRSWHADECCFYSTFWCYYRILLSYGDNVKEKACPKLSRHNFFLFFFALFQAALFWNWKLDSLLHFLILAYILIFFPWKDSRFHQECDIYVEEISKPAVVFRGLELWGNFI